MRQSDRRLNRTNINPGEPIWWDRGYHPHFESQRHIQHICVHLADSLPRAVVQQMAEELNRLSPALRDAEQQRRVNAYLDAGAGDCVLREREVATMVRDSLLHFTGERYRLHGWCIMPNHVHILLQPLNGTTISSSMASWKKFTGRRISAWRQQHRAMPPGPVWQREYFDRYIRDEVHYWAVMDYIHMNPVKAGLVQRAEDWEWSSAFQPA
jgi:REP element-mobilizing transposase RayT